MLKGAEKRGNMVHYSHGHRWWNQRMAGPLSVLAAQMKAFLLGSKSRLAISRGRSLNFALLLYKCNKVCRQIVYTNGMMDTRIMYLDCNMVGWYNGLRISAFSLPAN